MSYDTQEALENIGLALAMAVLGHFFFHETLIFLVASYFFRRS